MGEDGADVIVMKGSYSYTSPDGQLITVNWIADENGFQAIGDHLPKPVEIPFPEQRVAVEAQLKARKEPEAGSPCPEKETCSSCASSPS